MLTRKWPERFFAFQRQKFTQNSSGGGDWPPLAKSTLEQKQREGRSSRMLHVTNAIYNALFPGRPGNVIRRKGVGGIEMGIGGNARHPDTKLTIGQLAEIHHDGAGNVPARKVLYPLEVGAAGECFNDMALGFKRLVRSLPKLRRG